MQFFSNLAKSPVETLDTWQKTRYPWAIMAATMAGLVLVAHFVFQEWLYMAPCEQCGYIRDGNLVRALGGLIALINPRILAFGIQGCSAEAHYPFDLPLAQWAPGWFQQTGDCGYDSPMPPEGVDLSGLRGFLVDLYQSYDGWYLIPQWHFMDMAECCMLACVIAAAVLLAMFASSIAAQMMHKSTLIRKPV